MTTTKPRFGHLTDDQLEDIYGCVRALVRDVRHTGCYSLAYILNSFETDVALELNARATKEDEALRAQLTILDRWVDAV